MTPRAKISRSTTKNHQNRRISMKTLVPLIIIIFAAIIGCNSNPVQPDQPIQPNPAVLRAINVPPVIYDQSEGQLYFAAKPIYETTNGLTADSMWVNLQLFFQGSALNPIVVLPPKPQPCYWKTATPPADSVDAIICYKWQVGGIWKDTIVKIGLPIIAQP
jgi:hypothetical protein